MTAELFTLPWIAHADRSSSRLGIYIRFEHQLSPSEGLVRQIFQELNGSPAMADAIASDHRVHLSVAIRSAAVDVCLWTKAADGTSDALAVAREALEDIAREMCARAGAAGRYVSVRDPVSKRTVRATELLGPYLRDVPTVAEYIDLRLSRRVAERFRRDPAAAVGSFGTGVYHSLRASGTRLSGGPESGLISAAISSIRHEEKLLMRLESYLERRAAQAPGALAWWFSPIVLAATMVSTWAVSNSRLAVGSYAVVATLEFGAVLFCHRRARIPWRPPRGALYATAGLWLISAFATAFAVAVLVDPTVLGQRHGASLGHAYFASLGLAVVAGVVTGTFRGAGSVIAHVELFFFPTVVGAGVIAAVARLLRIDGRLSRVADLIEDPESRYR
jgi:hypothetical protein